MMAVYSKLKVGVLALQGDFSRHCYQLGLLGIEAVEVRLPEQLEGLDALIVPGGESTTMSTLIDRFGLRGPLTEFGCSRPVWGTCAGMIMLAANIEDNQAGVRPLGLLDIDVLRCGYGRQVLSFEADLTVNLNGTQARLAAAFIRAPKVTRLGPEVVSLAEYDKSPVLVSHEQLLASAFHTELNDDTALLEYFLNKHVGAV
ncbi:MAG: pyridoxal 5'-phosphate synthase glutaminase subunit PdxT [Candidatus Zixiibacteriota bacterium]